MERTAGRARRKRHSRRTVTGLPQLPWTRVQSTFQPIRLIDEEQETHIHETSMRVLEELGIEVLSPAALSVFERAGARVDYATRLVRLDRGLVEDALRTVPSSFELTPRNPARSLLFGEQHVNFGLVAGPPNIHDNVLGRRSGNYEDYCQLIKLAQHFQVIHLIGNQVTAPIEMPANSRHLDAYLANLLYSNLVFHCTAIGGGRARDGANMMAIARGERIEHLRERPGVITIISINSPRRLDESMADGLMAMAELGQAVVVTPFTLMGAMAPVSLCAALAQQNAEALFGIVLTQLVNPGAPAMYGAFTSNVDMRSGAPAFGTPENTKANIVSGQLARRYSIPYRSSNANASNAADAQAVYETEMSLWGAILGGASLIYHAAGWLEGGLTASYEKLVLDVEMLQHMVHLLQPLAGDGAISDFDAIAMAKPGGHFFGTEHTMAHYEKAFYQPLLSDWDNYENWIIKGGKDASARATDLWQTALEEYEQPAIDPAVSEELHAYVSKRKEEIGSGEP